MRLCLPLALVALLVALAGCGGTKKSSGLSTTSTPSPTKTANSSGTPAPSGSSGKGKVQLLVRSVTPGQTPSKPRPKAHIGASKTAQVFAYPTGAAAGDALEVRIPDFAGGKSHVTADILHGGQSAAHAAAVLTTSSGSASIAAVRYVCQVSSAPTYCPVDGRHANGAYVLRTKHLKAAGPLVMIVALG